MDGRANGRWRAGAAYSVLSSIAFAQVGVTGSNPERPTWERDWSNPWARLSSQNRPLDAGIEDVGPTLTSLRWNPSDLRAPIAFEDVYRDASGQLVRRDGALEAVFPRSSYVADRDGVFPTVPAGVVYRIDSGTGPLREYRPSPLALRGVIDRRVDGRAVDRRIGAVPSGQGFAQASKGEVVPLWTDEAYRRARVAALIGQASRTP